MKILIAFLVMFAATGCSTATDPAGMFHIHGVVINNATSLPAAGITVRAYTGGGCPSFGGSCSDPRTLSTAVSGPDGRYALDFEFENKLCPPFSVDAVAIASTKADFGGTAGCEERGRELELTIYITQQ